MTPTNAPATTNRFSSWDGGGGDAAGSRVRRIGPILWRIVSKEAGHDVEKWNPGRTTERGTVVEEPARRHSTCDRGDRRQRPAGRPAQRTKSITATAAAGRRAWNRQMLNTTTIRPSATGKLITEPVCYSVAASLPAQAPCRPRTARSSSDPPVEAPRVPSPPTTVRPLRIRAAATAPSRVSCASASQLRPGIVEVRQRALLERLRRVLAAGNGTLRISGDRLVDSLDPLGRVEPAVTTVRPAFGFPGLQPQHAGRRHTRWQGMSGVRPAGTETS